MKKLVVALMLITLSVTSCGKNNSTNSGVGSSTSGLSSSVVGAVESELAIKINNNNFGTGLVYVYGVQETMLQLANSYPNLKYNYGTISGSSSSSSNCAKIGGVPVLCWSGSFSGSGVSYSSTRQVIHSSVSDADQKSKLINLINNRFVVQRDSYYSSVYYIVGQDSTVYTIDTQLPLQANPVQTQKTDGTREVFRGWATY